MPNSSAFRTNNIRTLNELTAWQAQPAEAVLDPEQPIIDPHHHLREGPSGRYHLPELARDLAGGHNVLATVFVDSQSGYHSEGPELMRPVGETELIGWWLAKAPNLGHCIPCAGIVGALDLTHGAEVREGLLAHLEAGQGRFRGIRDPLVWDGSDINYGPRRPAADRMSDVRFRAGFAELAPLGLTFDAWVFHHQIPLLTDLARTFADTTIVLDHIGAPLGVGPYANRRAEVFSSWHAAIVELSRCPNVVVKLGGLGMLYFGFNFHLRAVPPSSEELAVAWRPFINACIDAFGPSRCMFESNFPVDKQTCSYTTLWNAFKRIAADCSPTDKSALFFGTANRVYRLGLNGA